MSIALFDEPPRVSINEPSVVGGSRNGLLMGLAVAGNDVMGVLCLEDGRITLAHASHFTIDFRYDPERNQWTDQNQPRGDQ